MKYRIISNGTTFIVQSRRWVFWFNRYKCSNIYGSVDAKAICERVIERLKAGEDSEEPEWKVL